MMLAELQGVIDDREERASELFRERLAEVKAEAVSEERFAEYTAAAAELKDKAIAALEVSIAKAEKREAEVAELAKLRAEDEERARKDREERIARARKSVVSGKSVSVRVDLGGRRHIKKQKQTKTKN